MWRALTIVLTLALAAALVPAIEHLREPPPPADPIVRSAFTAPPGVEPGAGDVMLDAAISADSTGVAFVAGRDGRIQLWQRPVDAAAPAPLTGTDGAAMPAWKPGNRIVSFFAGGDLRQVSLADGSVRRLAKAPAPAGASWQADGSVLFAGDANGPVTLLRNGRATPATTLRPGDRRHGFPAAIPGAGFLYVAVRSDGTRIVRLARGGDEADLTQTSGHADLIGNVLVWVRDGVLLGQRLDVENHRLLGRATALVARVGVAASGQGFFAASPRLLLAASGGAQARDLSWFDASGRRTAPILEPGDYAQVRLSPDDRRVAVTAVDPLLRTLDVFAAVLDRPGRLARLSLSLGPDSDPVWSSDSTRVAYRSVQRGSSRILTRDADATTSVETPLMHTQPDDSVTDWRGTDLLIQAPSSSSGLDVWLVNERTGTRTPVARGGFNESAARWSPDGSRIAYVSDESGQPDVYVVGWPGADRRVRASFGGGTRPQWGRDGLTLFFMRDTRIMRTRATRDGAAMTFSTPETVVDVPGLVDFSVAHGTDRFAVLTRAAGTRDTIADAISGWTSLVPPPPR